MAVGVDRLLGLLQELDEIEIIVLFGEPAKQADEDVVALLVD